MSSSTVAHLGHGLGPRWSRDGDLGAREGRARIFVRNCSSKSIREIVAKANLASVAHRQRAISSTYAGMRQVAQNESAPLPLGGASSPPALIAAWPTKIPTCVYPPKQAYLVLPFSE